MTERPWSYARERSLEPDLAPAREALCRSAIASQVDALYLPAVAWMRDLRSRANDPVVVGVNGPQGGGKSTLAARAVEGLGALGLRAVTLSIDDVYLTRPEQLALARAHPDNPLLAVRGAPGTHDVALGARLLDALRDGGRVVLPTYDKGAFDGAGDRAPEDRWRAVEGPFDLIVFEGWTLGFAPTSGIADPHLAAVNERLRAYAAWNRRLDALLHLDVDDLDLVVRWRVESEQRRRAVEGRGLTDEGARAYVTRFLPLYRAYLPGLRASPPVRGPSLRVVLGEDRLPQ